MRRRWKAPAQGSQNFAYEEEKPVNDNIKNSSVGFLFKAVLSLENLEECYDFFEDLCTVQELKAISQRIVVAKMLSEKRVYSDIVKETGASTATISRVNRSLIYGNDSFQKVFARLPKRWDTDEDESEEGEVAGE
jgi:TrpR-related protein YerC/YecD